MEFAAGPQPHAAHRQFKQSREIDDEMPMRRLFLISLLLGLSTSIGCMVLDELDSAAAKTPATHKSKDAATAGSDVPQDAGPTGENPLLAESKRWWKRATSLGPMDSKAGIVSCRLRNATPFMSRNDCLSRGGSPQNVSR